MYFLRRPRANTLCVFVCVCVCIYYLEKGGQNIRPFLILTTLWLLKKVLAITFLSYRQACDNTWQNHVCGLLLVFYGLGKKSAQSSSIIIFR